MRTPSPTGPLLQLARLYGVQTAYYDVNRQRRQAGPDTLMRVVQALGAPVSDPADVAAALRETMQALWQRPLEPVAVVWGGGPATFEVRLPAARASQSVACHLTLETGGQHEWTCDLTQVTPSRVAEIEGVPYASYQLPLPGPLPHGYHVLRMHAHGGHSECLVICAPVEAYSSPDWSSGRRWGAFLPLYSLHTERSWGAGDFSDMEALATWLGENHGSVLATLPLLPAFLDQPFEPSPYVPVSRLLWNEFYLDVTRVPELHHCPSVQARLTSTPFETEVESLRRASIVDYRRQMALKRSVLEELCRCCFSAQSQRLQSLQQFAQAHPFAEDYARFRAACEHRRTPWPAWPQPLDTGGLRPGDYDEQCMRYHLYAQWLAHQQVDAVRIGARERGIRLYLDFPLGVHPHGYDVWRNRHLFVSDLTAGAPPDAVFTSGQDWTFPPLHPQTLRQDRYGYVIACLRHHLQHSEILRVDHIMGFHRLFCIPRGTGPAQGAYVRYHSDELYAILALESWRSGTVVVGEDLGTVPPDVRPAMNRHGLLRSYVVQYELCCNSGASTLRVPPNAVASLNTHDMPPFAAFWRGLDIAERRALGLLDNATSRRELQARQNAKKGLLRFLRRRRQLTGKRTHSEAPLEAALAFLSASRACVVLVNLEDLWLETEPQNRPGTGSACPNWRRRARHPLEAMRGLPQVSSMLRQIGCIRKEGQL